MNMKNNNSQREGLICTVITFSLKSKERYNPGRFRSRAATEKLWVKAIVSNIDEGRKTFIGHKVGIIHGPKAINRGRRKAAGRDASECKDIFCQMRVIFKGFVLWGKNRRSLFDYRRRGSKTDSQLREIIPFHKIDSLLGWLFYFFVDFSFKFQIFLNETGDWYRGRFIYKS